MQIESFPLPSRLIGSIPPKTLPWSLPTPAAPAPADGPVVGLERVHEKLVTVLRGRQLGDVDRRSAPPCRPRRSRKRASRTRSPGSGGIATRGSAIAERDGLQLVAGSLATRCHRADDQGRVRAAVAVQVGDLRRPGPAGPSLRGLVLDRHVPDDAARPARDPRQPLLRRSPGIRRRRRLRRLEERVAVVHQQIRRVARRGRSAARTIAPGCGRAPRSPAGAAPPTRGTARRGRRGSGSATQPAPGLSPPDRCCTFPR